MEKSPQTKIHGFSDEGNFYDVFLSVKCKEGQEFPKRGDSYIPCKKTYAWMEGGGAGRTQKYIIVWMMAWWVWHTFP